MKGIVEERAAMLGEYIIESKATVRKAAKKFGVSKSTVHTEVTITKGFSTVQHRADFILLKYENNKNRQSNFVKLLVNTIDFICVKWYNALDKYNMGLFIFKYRYNKYRYQRYRLYHC